MKAIIAAGLMAGMALLGMSTGEAQADSCPVTQLCGPVSQEYPGDQNGARYAEVLKANGMPGRVTAAEANTLGQVVCKGRRKGFSGDQMVANFQSDIGASYGLAVNVVAMGEYHYCPNYWDMG